MKNIGALKSSLRKHKYSLLPLIHTHKPCYSIPRKITVKLTWTSLITADSLINKSLAEELDMREPSLDTATWYCSNLSRCHLSLLVWGVCCYIAYRLRTLFLHLFQVFFVFCLSTNECPCTEEPYIAALCHAMQSDTALKQLFYSLCEAYTC